MKRKLLITSLILAAFAGLIFSQPFFFEKSFLSFSFASGVRPFAALVESVFGSSNPSVEDKALIMENERLKAQLLALSRNPYFTEAASRKYLAVKVYSTYPFNNRDLITVNAGARDGLKPLMTVTVGGYALLGQIIEVRERLSVVRTIFDAGWEMPVKIGEGGVDALLVGGREPRLTLIVKEKQISAGDPVYAAGNDFPFGLKIGSVAAVDDEAGAAFQSAALLTPYEPRDLSEVFVYFQ